MKERYRHMMERVTLDDEKKKEIMNEMYEKKPARRVARPLRTALIAACACVLLMGTALAASPELRAMLWSSFAPYVQEIDPVEEESAVMLHDGIEGRIVSAVSDGFAIVYHVEFEDLEGDRVAQLMEQGREAAEKELQQYLLNMGSIGGRALSRSDFTALTFGGPYILSYDEESGVLTTEYFIIQTAPQDAERRIHLDMMGGAFGTKKLSALEASKVYASEGLSGRCRLMDSDGGYELVAWELEAAIQALPTRNVAVDNVQVTLQDWYSHVPVNEGDEIITVYEAMVSPVAVSLLHSRYIVAPQAMEFAVALADGSTVVSTHFGHSAYELNETAVKTVVDGEIVMSPRTYTTTWILEQAIDPEQVVGLWVDGVYIPLD